MNPNIPEVSKQSHLPTIVQTSIQNDQQFLQILDLKKELIINRYQHDVIEQRRFFRASMFGGILLSIGIYGLWDVYFGKTEKQKLKFKISVKCYFRSNRLI
ncbi:hypothetical protein pb186bvf_015241 [Paramecium bursaria]